MQAILSGISTFLERSREYDARNGMEGRMEAISPLRAAGTDGYRCCQYAQGCSGGDFRKGAAAKRGFDATVGGKVWTKSELGHAPQHGHVYYSALRSTVAVAGRWNCACCDTECIEPY